MSNFFNIATPAELEEHFGYPPSSEEITEGRDLCERDQDYNLAQLASLFYDRGDKDASDRYLEQIKNPERKLETSMLLYECRFA